MLEPLLWTLAIGGTEWCWRQRVSSRAVAWRGTAVMLLPVALLAPRPRVQRRGGARASLVGVCVAVFGYPLGRVLLADRCRAHPSDTLRDELVGLGLLALAEELIRGGQVEPVLGSLVTAGLFATKHALIDGRWRRVGGLGLFSLGLALVRRHSPAGAILVHVGANATVVVLGHWSGRDQF
jgi:hypothetical protein